MNPVILAKLRDHLEAVTGPGGPFPITGGIRWYVIDPRLGNLKERIRWAKGHQVGVLWRAGTREYRRAGHNTDAVAVIKAGVYWTSMEEWSHEGEYLLLEDALHYALSTFAAPGVDHAWLEGVEDLTISEDTYGEVLVSECTLAVRYHLGMPEPDYMRVRQVLVTLAHWQGEEEGEHIPIGGEG